MLFKFIDIYLYIYLSIILSNIFHDYIHIMYSTFIKFTVLSSDPVTRYLPSRENATLITQSIIIYIYIYEKSKDKFNKI